MKTYFAWRVATAALTSLALATLMFLLFRLLPGDPTMTVLSPALDPSVQQELRQRFGLDRPLAEQYLLYMARLLQGDLGVSFQSGAPASRVILERLWSTLFLMVPALAVAYALGIIVGAYLAWKRNSRLDLLVTLGSIVFRSAPIFWVAILFVLAFAVKIPLFPTGHMRTPGQQTEGLWQTYVSIDYLHHLVLPMTCMAIYYGCYPLLVMRTAMLEVLGEDFIELCRARGLSESRILFRHALRASLLPIATSVSLLAAYAVAGSVLLETVFSWPGLGRLMVRAVLDSDYPVAQGAFLLIGILAVSGNLLADVLYGLLDPRIRYR